jgi:hypothetical protein
MRQPAAPPSTTKTEVKGESKGPTINTCNALFTLSLKAHDHHNRETYD